MSGRSSAARSIGLRAVPGLPHDVEAVLFEKGSEGVTRQRMVVHDEHADRHQPPYRQRPGCRIGECEPALVQTRTGPGSRAS